MSEMGERVARDIEDYLVEMSKAWWSARPEFSATLFGVAKIESGRIARLAIKAMREPTKAMEQAGFYAGPCEVMPPLPYTGPDSTVMAPLVWRAMIDKALK